MCLNNFLAEVDTSLLAILIILFIIVITVSSRIIIVPQGYAYIVERVGVYQKTLPTGIHFIVPFVQKVSKKVSLHEQTLDINIEKVYTRDNKTLKVNAIIYFVVTDPKLSVYGVEDIKTAFEKQTAKSLRSITNDMALSEVTSSRNLLNTKLTEILNELSDPWGIKVNSLELNDVNVY